MSGMVAVVGMACRYPEADSPDELWENVLTQRRSFRRIPRERLSLADYHSADPGTPDAIYAEYAAVLEDYEFDRVRFRISGGTYRSADLTHWLALDVADAALADAGYGERLAFERSRTAVVVGNTLTGEFSRASVLRLRWPYVRRQVSHALGRHGWDDEARRTFLDELERDFKAPFPEFGEESLSGSLSNTIAGRICNTFDFGGGGYTVDGACASSLLAVTTACEALGRGDVDFALAGGVDLSLDPFELVGFAKTRALATDLMRVYDERSAGFWPGEGCGMVALARYEDALERGARIYGVIRGWGISSDGRGGITRPEQRGQSLALARAYARAGYPVTSVPLFEGHGTGTAVGDATELATIGDACRAGGGRPTPAVIGSIKANIGHTKAAAGVAALIKALLAVDRQVLPPATGCERPHPELTRPDAVLRVLPEARPWPVEQPLRASVSAMGFGGINTHLTLEGTRAVRRRDVTARERSLSATAQDLELFPFAGADRAELLRQVEALRDVAAELSFGQLGDLGVELAGSVEPDQPVRAAVLAATPAQLAGRLEALAAALRGDATADGTDVLLGEGAGRPRIGFLFSGQGSPTYLDGGALARRFPAVAEIVAGLEGGPDLRHTAIAQPAIVASSVAGAAVLAALGIEADIAVGHSLGELTALHWAGVLGVHDVVQLARARGQAMADCPGEPGIMVDLATDPATARELVAGVAATIAAYNAPERTVVSGPAVAVEQAVARARQRGIGATPVRVSHAFHSPMMEPAGQALCQRLKELDLSRPRRTVVSTVTGAVLEPGTDLTELLVRQLTEPVRFTDALRAAGPLDLLVEVGPGRLLGTLAAASGRSALATDAAGPQLAPLLRVVAAAFVAGAPVQLSALAAGRTPGRKPALRPRRFLGNPCEQAPDQDAGAGPGLPRSRPGTDVPAEPATAGVDAEVAASGRTDPLGVLRKLVAARAELPMEAVTAPSRLLTDLHLNSITVAQIATDAAGLLGVRPLLDPTQFADATLSQLAAVLADSEPDDGADGAIVAGVAPWIRVFEPVWKPAARPGTDRVPTRWRVMADEDDRWATAMRTAFGADGAERTAGAEGTVGAEGDPAATARGLAVLVGPGRNAATARLLVAVAHEALDAGRCDRIAVVHRAGAAGFVKTLSLELPGLPVRLVELPDGEPADLPELLHAARLEAETGAGFAELRLPALTRREVPRLRAVRPRPADPYLGRDDVLLVTGGGKGIGAECALALAGSSGARVALLGRSAADDPQVAATVARFRAAGHTVEYVQADAGVAEAVRAAVARVRDKLGEPTAVLHSAGVNEPARLADVTPETVDRTVRPKSAGLAHLLAELDPGRLRLLLAFGSIIGAGGMPGEAHYALANDWLRLDVEEAARRLPHCRCRVVEWSVWSGAGMGERLGLLQSMLRRGVSPIGLDEGVALCRDIVDDPELPVSVVVTGRYGQLPTLPLDGGDLPLLRFLDKPLIWYPGVELVAETTLSLATDRYLADHSLAGVPLVPAVLGLEAMAQAAGALFGRPVTAISDVELPRPITVPVDGGRVIRLAALREGDVVRLAVRSDETSYGVDHFRAVCRFDEPTGDVFPEAATLLPNTPTAEGELPDGLYGGLLFHGPRFRRVRHYPELRARRAVAEIAVDDDADWFGAYLSSTLLLGDFGARDAFLHAAQASVPHRRVLPRSIGRIDLVARPRTGPARVVAVERYSDRTTLRFDLAVLDERGRPYEVWRDLELRAVEPLPVPDRWPPALAVPYLERRLGELGLPVSGLALHRDDAGQARRGRSAAALASLLGPAAVLRYRPDGRPEVDGDGEVSTAHGSGFTLAVHAAGPVAADIEPVESRDRDTWRGMLGDERLGLADELARQGPGGFDEAATRVWTAAECLTKAGAGGGPVPLVREHAEADGWVVLRAGRWRVATVVTRLDGVAAPLGLAVSTDAALPDAVLPDAVVPDAALPDAVLPDAALPGALLPDAALPDGGQVGVEESRPDIRP
ncbi:type I polyketide synthase [Plantactinospora mayteni]|uniref:Polyketide synthase n=1 Tax=Plantactinospora mayteni TaxID=566021 RepID=A0ABQ4ER37_9ACTN|nr:type I polyketide synthase [Plantactinospora mayteni]GIG97142.1 polyketide synthase [Plantactinospora mayteni]